MSLVTTKAMFNKAWIGGYAVGAFTVNNMEMIQAVVDAAREMRSPVILQISANGLRYAGAGYLKRIAEVAAEESDIPVAIHLDHGEDIEMCRACIDMGFTSVMIDASSKPFDENVKITKEVVAYAHDQGVVVEAELGRLAGVEDDINVSSDDARYTDPAQAVEFVELTGCDSLAVAVGTSHGSKKFSHEPHLAFDRLEKLTQLLSGFPLVLHGASSLPADTVALCNRYGGSLKEVNGVPEDLLRCAASLGICKINTDTDLRLAMTTALRQHFSEYPAQFDPRQYMGPARDAVREVVKHKMANVFCCAGKAD